MVLLASYSEEGVEDAVLGVGCSDMGMEIRPFFKDEYTEPKVWFWFGFLVAFYTVQPGSYSNDRRSGSPRRL